MKSYMSAPINYTLSIPFDNWPQCIIHLESTLYNLKCICYTDLERNFQQTCLSSPTAMQYRWVHNHRPSLWGKDAKTGLLGVGSPFQKKKKMDWLGLQKNLSKWQMPLTCSSPLRTILDRIWRTALLLSSDKKANKSTNPQSCCSKQLLGRHTV